MVLGLSSLLTAVVALLVVLGLVWAGARMARFSGLAPRSSGGRLLTLRDSLAVDARRRLLVVRCGTSDVVLLTGGPQDVVVGWLSPAAEPAAAPPGAEPRS